LEQTTGTSAALSTFFSTELAQIGQLKLRRFASAMSSAEILIGSLSLIGQLVK
jgi:hypothetical protein